MADNWSLEAHIAEIPASGKYHIEVNRISWYGRPVRIDIRRWNKDRSECRTGVTMTDEELVELYEAIGRYLND